MASQNFQARTLDSFCQNSSCLRVRIAVSTFYKVQFSAWIEKSLLIYEYLQLISQVVLSIPEGFKGRMFLSEIIIYVLKLINPCYLFMYKSSSEYTISPILVILFVYTWVKLVLFAHIVYASARNRKVSRWLLLIWRWIYRFQIRVLYFLFSSFWVRAIIEAKENGFGLFGMSEAPMIFISCLMIVVDFLLSMILETQLCYFLPTKSFLSAKNNHLELATFLQKFIIQSVLLIFKSNSEAIAWILPIVGVTMDIVRLYGFFSTLPLYRMKALSLQGGLLSTVMSINLLSFVNIILQSSDYKDANINFLLVTWILLALLVNKVSYELLKIQTLSLLTTSKTKQYSPELLLHKVALTKELCRNQKIPTGETLNFNFNYLVSMQQTLNIQEIFGLDSVPEDDPKIMKNIYLYSCQELSKKYPENSLIRLHTAYRSLKSEDSFTKVLKLVTEIRKYRWSKNYLGASLLLHEIEKSILKSYRKGKQDFDLYHFMESKMQIDNLRNDILEQINLHIKICNSMLSDICDIEEIHHSAQKISHLKTNIHQQIDRLSRNLSEYYVSPLLIYAEYNLVVNDSKEKFEKYYEMYSQRSLKAQGFFQESTLREENLYQDSNALILISTQKSEYGKIVYCNKSLVDLCGGQNIKLYEGSNISILFPHVLKDYVSNLFSPNEILKESSMNKIHHAYLYNKDKYLIEVEFCFKYHPYLTQGLCLTMIVRPVPASGKTEFLLLSKDGEIEGASKKLLKLLRLKENSPFTRVSIGDLSYDLGIMNSAFNVVLKERSFQENKDSVQDSENKWMSKFIRAKSVLRSPDVKLQHTDFTYEDANDIYNAFISEGQEIQFNNSRDDEGEFLKFNSRVQIVEYGDIKLKLVTLKKIGHEKHYEEMIINRKIDIEENYQPVFDDPGSSTLPYFDSQMENSTVPASTERRNLIGNDRLSLFGSSVEMTENNEINHANLSYVKRIGISTQSAAARRTTEKAENKIFRLAILSKSYPKSFISLCFTFYLVIVLTFAGQIIMKTTSDSTMRNLEIRKNLLRYSEEKTYQGIILQLNAQGMMLVISSVLAVSGAYVDVEDTVINMQLVVGLMKVANDAMLDLVYSLDEEIQNEMFQNDVLMKGVYLDGDDPTFEYVDIFEVTPQVGNAVRTFANDNLTSLERYNIANYMNLNLCNDFLYKSAQITEMLTQSVSDQRDSFQNITNLFLILNPFLLTGIGILLCCIIWNQYRIEKGNMRAFLKIPAEGVKTVANRLYQFQKNLRSEEVLTKKWVSTGIYDSRRPDRQSAYSRKSETQKIKYEALQKRYYKYIARVVVSISVLVAITVWDLIVTRKAIKVIYNRQGQLQFANYISSRMVIAHMTINEVFLTNNTQKVEHKVPFEGIIELVEVMKEIQSDIPQKFLEVDGTYNPEVKDILFVDNPTCKGFNNVYIHYCQVQAAVGRPTDMMVTLSYYQTLMNQKINDYVSVDKSSMGPIIAVALASDASLVPAIIIAEEAHLIASIMDASLTEKITEMQNLKIVIIVVFGTGLFVVSVLIWVYILQMIRDVHNDFKRVLQVFPSNLILSSYLLKRFLQRTSNGLIFRKL